jgi:hypothetical protein
MNERKQNSTGYPVQFFLTSSTDHISGATGLTPTVTLSKNGGAFAAASGAVTEVGNGWYSLAGNATDRNTLGELLLHATATGADPTERLLAIVPWDPFDPNLALQALPAASPGSSGGLPVVDALGGVKVSVGTGTGQLNLASGNVTVATNNDKTGYALSTTEHVQVATAIWTDATSSDFTVANSAGAKLFALSGGGSGGGPTAAQIATAILTDTTTSDLNVPGSIGYLITQNLDAKVSSRLASSTYAAPPTPAQVATAVWSDTTTSDFSTTGSPGKTLMTNLDTNVGSRSTYAGGPVASVTAPVTVGANNDKTGYTLAASGLDPITVESGVNFRQAQAVILAASCGDLSGANTTTITIKAGNNPGVTRITAPVDTSGDRTGVTLNLPA